MEQTTVTKLSEMLSSDDQELVNLAVKMFCKLTNDYMDYCIVRKASVDIHKEQSKQNMLYTALNKMFMHVTSESVWKYAEKLHKEMNNKEQ